MKPNERKSEEKETDFSQFAMNPVDIAEKADQIAAVRRSLKVAGIVVAIVAVVLGITAWARLGQHGGLHGMPLDQARDPSIRLKAEEFKQALVSDVQGLAGRLDAVQFVGSAEIRVDIRPAVTEPSGATRPLGKAEVGTILETSLKQFVSFLKAIEVAEYDEVIVRGYMKGAPVGTARYQRATGEAKIELAPGLGPG